MYPKIKLGQRNNVHLYRVYRGVLGQLLNINYLCCTILFFYIIRHLTKGEVKKKLENLMGSEVTQKKANNKGSGEENISIFCFKTLPFLLL